MSAHRPYLQHPVRINQVAPFIVGRWMVTGPDFEDGSGWSLCIHKDGKCQRCVASFTDQEDAEHAARIHDKWETAVVQGKATVEQIEGFMAHWNGMIVTMPDGPAHLEPAIEIGEDGKHRLREVSICQGPDPNGVTDLRPAPQTHELSGTAYPVKGFKVHTTPESMPSPEGPTEAP